MKHYEFIDHTADIGIRVKGKTLPQLFANAGYALFDIILEDVNSIRPLQSCKINIQGEKIEDLFFDWLRELLKKFNTEHLVFREFDVKMSDSRGLEATCMGEKINPSTHSLKTEIKAVTCHALTVKKKKEGWEATVIFDI